MDYHFFSRDGTIKLFNTVGECKYSISDDGHDGWVTSVKFSPNTANPIIVSCGTDKVVKVGAPQQCPPSACGARCS